MSVSHVAGHYIPSFTVVLLGGLPADIRTDLRTLMLFVLLCAAGLRQVRQHAMYNTPTFGSSSTSSTAAEASSSSSISWDTGHTGQPTVKSIFAAAGSQAHGEQKCANAAAATAAGSGSSLGLRHNQSAPFIPSNLPWKPLDLASADIIILVSSWQGSYQAVAPVQHMQGGSSAGYARWEGFKSGGGLALYAAQRNDAMNRNGVSRLSPYHRYGMVSPFRVAREAGAAGAVKFLDEFLTWREISYHFYWHGWGGGQKGGKKMVHTVSSWTRNTRVYA